VGLVGCIQAIRCWCCVCLAVKSVAGNSA
jgi:hypothetical protein